MRIAVRPALILVVAALSASCAGGPPPPAALDMRGAELCGTCRMVLSDQRTAAQIVERGEEPRFFDDLGCLQAYLGTAPDGTTVVPSGTVPTRMYVADHRTGEWVPAESAIFARVPSVDTPMGSHLLAWKDDTSRRQDPAGNAAVELVDARVVLGRAGATR